MKIYLAQLNPTIGAIDANGALIRQAYADGVASGADVVMVPELAVTGYPPRDLLEKKSFIDANLAMRDSLIAMTGETVLIFGCAERNPQRVGKPLLNVAVVAQHGRHLLSQVKSLLPTYDVFDELRHFEPASEVRIVELFGRRVGVSICEDFWFGEVFVDRQFYARNPIEPLVEQGAELLLNISASPFNHGKKSSRHQLFRDIAVRHRLPVVYVNQVGGNDELVFDGSSIVIDPEGQTVYCARSFETDAAMVSLRGAPCDAVTAMSPTEEVLAALDLGLKDYVAKNGFRDVVIGLSGGIDSAVTAAIAVDALGPERVCGLAMPSPFSSQGSVDDALSLARNLGIECHVIPIGEIYESYRGAFAEMFGEREFNLTDENVQARIRGNLLMAWSNEKGAMVLSTGNKSELAVGYCTLYGDMAGGLSPLGDVYKTTVYELARLINRERERIPESSITKPPSAELRPDQTDQDSLPPYEVLDPILKLYIEQWHDIDEIVGSGFDREIVTRVIRLVDGNEFKRRQAAPAIRVSTKAFGSGRLMPIAQQWKRRLL